MTKTVLVADDDDDDFVLTRTALAGLTGVKVSRAHDGLEVLDLLRARPAPDLLLLDLEMPRCDGWEVLRQVREGPAAPALRCLPVVVLSSAGTEQAVRLAYLLGANSYLRKPAGFEALAAALEVVVRYWFSVVELPAERTR